jgi:hypothetical protein
MYQLTNTKKIITVYSENHTKHMNALRENVKLFHVKAGGSYSNYCGLQGYYICESTYNREMFPHAIVLSTATLLPYQNLKCFVLLLK